MKYVILTTKEKQSFTLPVGNWKSLRRTIKTARLNGYRYKLVEAAE